MAAGRVILDQIHYYDKDLPELVAYIFMAFAVLIEIGAIAFYLVSRNNSLNKYSSGLADDRKFINFLIIATYIVFLVVIGVFTALYGLSTIEQLLAFL